MNTHLTVQQRLDADPELQRLEARSDWARHALLVMHEFDPYLNILPTKVLMTVADVPTGNWQEQVRVTVAAINEGLARSKVPSIEPKIVEAAIREGDSTGYMQVHAKFSNGTEKVVVTYFADELSFTADEFVGMTDQQASELHTRKDLQYLRS